jgi:phosphate transport system protein
MFKEIFSALRGGESLDRAFEQFVEMLGHAHWMFMRANDVLRGLATPSEVQDAIYSRDQAINELERSIRRKILRHLVINAGSDVPACLALMSVAKDAERIGDYCKNVFEVGRFYTQGFHVPAYHDRVDAIRQKTRELFPVVIEAFRDSDDKKARQAIRTAGEIRGECDTIIEQLLRQEIPVQTHEAVAYSLLARHYKRVAAHLGNISTAVLGRLEDLDFRTSAEKRG